jgi:hypothetical protein
MKFLLHYLAPVIGAPAQWRRQFESLRECVIEFI